jgi:hypothetical protein
LESLLILGLLLALLSVARRLGFSDLKNFYFSRAGSLDAFLEFLSERLLTLSLSLTFLKALDDLLQLKHVLLLLLKEKFLV